MSNFMRNNKREIIFLTIYILFAVLQLGILPLLLISELLRNNWVNSDFILFAFNLGVPGILGVILFWKEIREGFSYFKDHPFLKIVSIPLWLVVILIAENISKIAYGFSETPDNEATISTLTDNAPLFFVIVVFGILGPILEEIIFRHIFLGKLSEYTGVIIAIIISVSLFTLGHVQKPMDILIYSPGAIILAIVYLKTKKSLTFVILLHMLNNILGLIY